MDAVKFVKERNRMCHSFENCDGCPLLHENCDNYIDVRIESVVQAVEQWSAAHPCKTRQSVFLEHWPEARIDKSGILEIFPCAVCATLRNKRECCTSDFSCVDCRREFWMQGVE
nr:MAG TPA: hypothetical protein [Caudoviricetes sp.]